MTCGGGQNISIHALLAESDHGFLRGLPKEHLFLSTLSLRRATKEVEKLSRVIVISIHALLAESDVARPKKYLFVGISIHALLAESDHTGVSTIFPA